MTRTRLLCGVFAALVAANLAAVASGSGIAEWLTKPLLMPALIAYLWSATGGGRHVRVIVVALAAATFADIALLIPGDPAFLIGMGLFAVTQVSFMVAFVRLSAIRRVSFTALAGYFAVWASFNFVLGPAFAPLTVPIALYSLLLLGMACLAAGLGWRTALGGALFVISDALIGLGIAGMDFAGRSVLIMATYTVAQFLLAHGWWHAWRRFARPTVESGTASAPSVSR